MFQQQKTCSTNFCNKKIHRQVRVVGGLLVLLCQMASGVFEKFVICLLYDNPALLIQMSNCDNNSVWVNEIKCTSNWCWFWTKNNECSYVLLHSKNLHQLSMFDSQVDFSLRWLLVGGCVRCNWVRERFFLYILSGKTKRTGRLALLARSFTF